MLESRISVPWGKIAPGAGRALVTADDLLALPDDGWRYEVVEGVLIRVAGSGEDATAIAAIILGVLIAFVRPRRLGVVTGADGVYTFPTAETGLLPDVGFFAAARLPLLVDRSKPIPFAPDLAVEVASSGQSASDLAAKARRYLSGGTSTVWVVWPPRREIDVWYPAATEATRPTITLREGDTLDGGMVIPGFSHPVADLFDVL